MEINEENELALFADLVEIEIGRREKRPMCETCGRPSGVCWCRNLNGEKVSTNCRVFILQHPHEEKRCLRTVPILEALIPKENCSVIKGKKFNPSRCPELKNELSNENSILMYPGQNAVDIEDLPPVGGPQLPYNIFILDGTWQQAKSMFFRNPYLRDLKQVRLSGRHISEYVIRRQPTDDALSTVEVVAVALSTLEQDWKIYSSLVEPLKLICQYQMDHGAVKHHSKEYLILTGRYQKPVGKRTYKKFKKCGVRNSDPCVWELRRNLNESEVGNREDNK
ncbi:DTW domain-containing protein 2 [Armadillidium nasatum]|uniref:tRNA-uridine aminocarboxypropyltransferase n=1 Tax=Armadillidium nasatum TaxID=96803 RepID=A0A5N5T3M1_9CRUS|nr:DTW domain-containing protein 2 [Armadillidium nasatum]